MSFLHFLHEQNVWYSIPDIKTCTHVTTISSITFVYSLSRYSPSKRKTHPFLTGFHSFIAVRGTIRISTLLFFALPFFVSLEATGLNSPCPLALNISGSKSLFSRRSFIKFTDRITLRSQLDSYLEFLIGILSVCPLTMMFLGKSMTSNQGQ